MALRELLLKLGVDVDPAGVKKADDALAKIKKAAIVAAAAFVAIKAIKGIASIADDVRGIGDELDKTSQQIGISTDALQEWRFAAGLAGASGTEMSNSLAKLQKNAFDAATGGTEMADDFKKLGVSVLDSNGQIKDANTLLTDMADGFAALTNDTERSALAQNLMGRAGKKLIPLLKGGSKAIAEMKAEAQSLGGILGKDLIAATVKLTDDQLRSQQAWQGVKNDIAGKIIPIFIKFSNLMIGVAKAIRGPLNTAISVFGGIIEAIVTIVETLIGTFGELDNIFDQVTIGIGALGFAFLILGRKAVVAGIKTAAAWVLASLPIILMTLLVGFLLLAIEDFITFMRGGDSVIGRIVGRFREWVDEMGGIGPAMKKLFIDIFMSIFNVSKETADKIVTTFQAIWFAIKETFDKIGTAIGEGLAAAFIFVEEFAADFARVFTEAIDTVIEKYEALTDAVANFIQAAAEATGLDALVDKGAEVDVAGDRKRARERTKRIKDEAANRVKILRQLEREGFGTFVGATETATGRQASQLTGARAGAQERLTQLQQNINAPLTVNVDASGQTNPAAIADSVATKIVRTQSNRQIAQSFQTAK